ncbi:MAG TPA: hypothetical protein VH590_15940 [Ktedonobacterales bacterium]
MSGLAALAGFLLPWFVIGLWFITEPVQAASFNMSGWEVALHLGKGALWIAPLGALALVGIALLRKMQGISRFVLNLLALLLGGISLAVIMLALGSHSVPVPGAHPMFVVGEGPSFGLYLTLLGLLIGALSGLVGLFKIRISLNYHKETREDKD